RVADEGQEAGEEPGPVDEARRAAPEARRAVPLDPGALGTPGERALRPAGRRRPGGGGRRRPLRPGGAGFSGVPLIQAPLRASVTSGRVVPASPEPPVNPEGTAVDDRTERPRGGGIRRVPPRRPEAEPVVDLDSLLKDAYEADASDIHL